MWFGRVLASVAMGCAVALAVRPAEARIERVFGARAFQAASLDGLPQWQAVVARIEAERPVYTACDADQRQCPNRGTLAWRALLRGLAGMPRARQVSEVNRFVNAARYRADGENYGRSDYWASPLEFLARSGDCEDYAIIKYVSLRELGVPMAELRVVVLQDTVRELAHAVLAVQDGERTVILDNLTGAILPQERITHYRPYYSLDETTRWAHLPTDTTGIVAAISPRVLLGK